MCQVQGRISITSFSTRTDELPGMDNGEKELITRIERIVLKTFCIFAMSLTASDDV